MDGAAVAIGGIAWPSMYLAVSLWFITAAHRRYTSGGFLGELNFNGSLRTEAKQLRVSVHVNRQDGLGFRC